jgi:ribosomal protein S18 acetylase RimI-like enzyme
MEDEIMSEPSGITNIEIRKPQHADELRTCAQLMATSEPWITLRRTYEESLKILGDPSREVYVAVKEREVVGFIILNMNGPFIGYIQTVCITPAWRSKGIGSQLLQFAEERIFRDVPNVFMCVSSFNTEAQKLYRRLGYEIVGELKDYVVSGHAEILLRKTIAPLTEFKKNP